MHEKKKAAGRNSGEMQDTQNMRETESEEVVMRGPSPDNVSTKRLGPHPPCASVRSPSSVTPSGRAARLEGVERVSFEQRKEKVQDKRVAKRAAALQV